MDPDRVFRAVAFALTGQRLEPPAALAAQCPDTTLVNVAVREAGDQVIFLHRLEAGGTDRSYGIHVAQLAGLPGQVVRRAREVLRTLEGDHRVVPGEPPVSDPGQLALFGEARPHPVVGQLKGTVVVRMTPLEALNLLADLNRRSEG